MVDLISEVESKTDSVIFAVQVQECTADNLLLLSCTYAKLVLFREKIEKK